MMGKCHRTPTIHNHTSLILNVFLLLFLFSEGLSLHLGLHWLIVCFLQEICTLLFSHHAHKRVQTSSSLKKPPHKSKKQQHDLCVLYRRWLRPVGTMHLDYAEKMGKSMISLYKPEPFRPAQECRSITDRLIIQGT